MKFVRFLENRFQELKMEEGTQDQFDVRIDSEIKATHHVLEVFRKITQWLLMFKVTFDYLLVNLGIKDEPQPVLLNKIREDQQAKLAAEEMIQSSNNVTHLTEKSESSPTSG